MIEKSLHGVSVDSVMNGFDAILCDTEWHQHLIRSRAAAAASSKARR